MRPLEVMSDPDADEHDWQVCECRMCVAIRAELDRRQARRRNLRRREDERFDGY